MSTPKKRRNMNPPDDVMNALFHLIYKAILDARIAAWSAIKEPTVEAKDTALERIADLMDAIHNIPTFMNRWENWDDKMFRTILQCHDEKWDLEPGAGLEGVYDSVLNEEARK